MSMQTKQLKQPMHPYIRLRKHLEAYEKGDRDCLAGHYDPPTDQEEQKIYDLAWWLAEANQVPVLPWM